MNDGASSTASPLLPPGIRRVLLGLATLGGIAFLLGLALDEGRAWQALLVNFLFFGGLAQAGVVLSCILQVTSARWGRPLKRVAEATAAFLPVAFVLLLVLLAGTAAWAPWVHDPVEAKTPWLNLPFFVTRELLAFLVLSGFRPALCVPLGPPGHRHVARVGGATRHRCRGATHRRLAGHRLRAGRSGSAGRAAGPWRCWWPTAGCSP